MEQMNIPVVGAILEKKEQGEIYVLVQTRRKPGTPYHNTIETPVGWIKQRENVYQALHREIKEETNLDITHINTQNTLMCDSSIGYSPRYCTQQLRDGLPRMMLGFICRCSGEAKQQEEETRNPRRVSLQELEHMLKHEKIFALQRPFFEQYLAHHKEITFQSFIF